MFKQILCITFLALQLATGIMLIKLSGAYDNNKYTILLTTGIAMIALLPLVYTIYSTIIDKIVYDEKIKKIIKIDPSEILRIENTSINNLNLVEILKFIVSHNSHDKNIISSCKLFIRQNINHFGIDDNQEFSII